MGAKSLVGSQMAGFCCVRISKCHALDWLSCLDVPIAAVTWSWQLEKGTPLWLKRRRGLVKLFEELMEWYKVCLPVVGETWAGRWAKSTPAQLIREGSARKVKHAKLIRWAARWIQVRSCRGLSSRLVSVTLEDKPFGAAYASLGIACRPSAQILAHTCRLQDAFKLKHGENTRASARAGC